MENEPFEDVFPIENGDFPLLCLITGVYHYFWKHPSLLCQRHDFDSIGCYKLLPTLLANDWHLKYNDAIHR